MSEHNSNQTFVMPEYSQQIYGYQQEPYVLAANLHDSNVSSTISYSALYPDSYYPVAKQEQNVENDGPQNLHGIDSEEYSKEGGHLFRTTADQSDLQKV